MPFSFTSKPTRRRRTPSSFCFANRSRPCLLYQIKRCSGPCTREIDFAEYSELAREANAFLSGKSRAVKSAQQVILTGAEEKVLFHQFNYARYRVWKLQQDIWAAPSKQPTPDQAASG